MPGNAMGSTRQAAAVVCIALVVFAAFVPAMASALGSVVLVPLWIVRPAVVVMLVRFDAFRCDEQPFSLLAILDSRAPPLARILG